MLNLWKRLQIASLECGPIEVIWGRNKDSKCKHKQQNWRNKSRKLYKIDPFLDNDGLLQVVGRLGKSRLSHSEAHPLVQNKATYQKQSYDNAMKMLPMVAEEWP